MSATKKKKFNQVAHCEACGRGVSYSSLELFEWARRVERAKLEKELKILRASVQFLSTQESPPRPASASRGVRAAITPAAATVAANLSA